MTPAELKAYRLSLGFTGQQMAYMLGVSQPAVSQWESGKHPIPTMAINLINALKTIDEMMQARLPMPIPEGLCACGCGQATVVNWRSDRAKRWEKGQYRAFLKGHNSHFARAEK